MAVRSTVLCRGHVPVASSPAVVGTVPAGEVWIVKRCAVTNTSGGGLDAWAYSLSSDGTILDMLVPGQFLPNNSSLSYNGWAVLVTGDQLVVHLDGGAVDVWASGAALAL